MKLEVTMILIRVLLTALLLPFLLTRPCQADPAQVIHYAPAENLEHIDVALIDTATREIDMAAYVLTDWPIMLPHNPRRSPDGYEQGSETINLARKM